jgi:hypothetical protein
MLELSPPSLPSPSFYADLSSSPVFPAESFYPGGGAAARLFLIFKGVLFSPDSKTTPGRDIPLIIKGFIF